MPGLHESCAPIPPQSIYLLISFSISMCVSGVRAFTRMFSHVCTCTWRPKVDVEIIPNHSSTLFVETQSINRTQSLPVCSGGIPSPPSKAGLSGRLKCPANIYKFSWVCGIQTPASSFTLSHLPSLSQLSIPFRSLSANFFFPTAEISSLLHLPSYHTHAPQDSTS